MHPQDPYEPIKKDRFIYIDVYIYYIRYITYVYAFMDVHTGGFVKSISGNMAPPH